MGYIPGNNDARQWTEECLQIATNQNQISSGCCQQKSSLFTHIWSIIFLFMHCIGLDQIIVAHIPYRWLALVGFGSVY